MSRLTAPIPSHLRTSTFPLPGKGTEANPSKGTSPLSLATELNPLGVPTMPADEQPSSTDNPPPTTNSMDLSPLRRFSSTLPYTKPKAGSIAGSERRVGPRWLVVVIPPKTWVESKAASSPAGRTDTGVLMPLHSTMSAQLTAIAREFSLPSTLGLSTYVRLPTTPPLTARASDDSWPILWSHHLSPSAPSTPFPVAGSVEFEIDLIKAKWFLPWSNGVLPVEAPGWTTAASESTTRVVPPRRLSLLDRRAPGHNPSRLFESTTSASLSESSIVEPEVEVEARPLLSAIPQLDSPPQSSHKLQSDLNAAVQAWRATSVVGSPLPGTTLAHPSPAPSSPSTASSLDPNEYSYSISSAGPSSPIPSPLILPPTTSQRRRARSVHLQDILAGSVPCTPSTRTSWGPGSPYPSWSALVTPMGIRTPDIGERAMEEGAKRSGWPVEKEVGWRMVWPYFVAKTREEVVRPVEMTVRLSAVYPTFELYPPGYPHLEIYPATSFPVASTSKPVSLPVTLPRSAGGYPSFDLYPAQALYPALEIYPVVPSAEPKPKSLSVSLSAPQVIYPSFNLYPAQYPTLTIYPAMESRQTPPSKPDSLSVTLSTPQVIYPTFNLYPAQYPTLDIYPALHLNKEERAGVKVTLERVTGYPTFDLYPGGYPCLDISPVVVLGDILKETVVEEMVEPKERPAYPVFDIYPALYPYLTPYPAVLTAPSRPTPILETSDLLPPLPSLPTRMAAGTRGRAGTVSRAPQIAPLKPSTFLPSTPESRGPSSESSPASSSDAKTPSSVPRSREELHALIFGSGSSDPVRMGEKVLDERSSPSPTRRVVGLPGEMYQGKMRIVSMSAPTDAGVEDVTPRTSVVLRSPVVLSRSGSLGRGDAMFAQRRARVTPPPRLHTPPRSASLMSEFDFPAPPGWTPPPLSGTPTRSISAAALRSR